MGHRTPSLKPSPISLAHPGVREIRAIFHLTLCTGNVLITTRITPFLCFSLLYLHASIPFFTYSSFTSIHFLFSLSFSLSYFRQSFESFFSFLFIRVHSIFFLVIFYFSLFFFYAVMNLPKVNYCLFLSLEYFFFTTLPSYLSFTIPSHSFFSFSLFSFFYSFFFGFKSLIYLYSSGSVCFL